MANTEKGDTLSIPLTRRGLVTAITVGITPISACVDIPFTGDQTVILPPFTGAWVEIRKDTTAAVKLHFDGDIQAKIDNAPVSRQQLLGMTSTDETDVSLSTVDIPWSPDHPDRETVTGTIKGKVVTESWPGATWYKTGSLEFLGTDSFDNVSVTFQDPSVHVRLPSGYQYRLPEMQTAVSNQSTVNVKRTSGGLFDYEEMQENRAVPRINHYDLPAAVWMRASAEYRARLFNRTRHLFNFDWYENKTYEDVRGGVAEISSMLGKEAIESVLTSPLPSSVTAPLDMKSIHDTLNGDYASFRRGLESIERLTNAARNETWMSVLTPGGTDQPGWQRFERLAYNEWQFRNPLWVTAHDTQRFKFHLTRYKQTLQQQEKEMSQLVTDSVFRTGNPSQEYWRNLYALARQILDKARNMVRKEHQTLEELKSEFSNNDTE